jgi:hypothetical protein
VFTARQVRAACACSALSVGLYAIHRQKPPSPRRARRVRLSDANTVEAARSTASAASQR